MRHHLSIFRSIVIGLLVVCACAGVLVMTIDAHAKQVTKQEAAAATAAKLKAKNESTETLTKLLNNFAASYNTTNSKKVSAVVVDLSNGAEATVDANQQIVSASIYKLFVAYDIYRQIDEGTVSLDQQLTDNEAGQTVDGCLNLMITVSDNDCGVALGEIDGWANLDTLLHSQGYNGTLTNNYDSTGAVSGDKLTTANDVALLLKRLYDGTLLSKTSTADFLNYLKNDQINDYLPTGLPASTVIAHKIGELYGYIHDAGIVYGPKKDTVIVLLSGQWDDPENDAPPVFAQLSSAVWSYMEQ